MPRNRNLRKTDAHPRDTGSFVPYLDDFCKLAQPSEKLIKTGDLLRNYLNYVSVRSKVTFGTEPCKIKVVNEACSGFRRAFRAIALHNRWRESSKPRGYYVEIPRITRDAMKGGPIPKCDREDHVLFEKKFIDKTIGYGVFASCNITENCQIIEYEGQWIRKMESDKRDKYYEKHGFPPVAVHDPHTGLILDANRDKNGKMFDYAENIARYFNHSKKNANCKLISKTDSHNFKRLYLVSLMNIPKGAQFLWDYGENDVESIKSNPWLLI